MLRKQGHKNTLRRKKIDITCNNGLAGGTARSYLLMLSGSKPLVLGNVRSEKNPEL
jgi:hypothetical protein